MSSNSQPEGDADRASVDSKADKGRSPSPDPALSPSGQIARTEPTRGRVGSPSPAHPSGGGSDVTIAVDNQLPEPKSNKRSRSHDYARQRAADSQGADALQGPGHSQGGGRGDAPRGRGRGNGHGGGRGSWQQQQQWRTPQWQPPPPPKDIAVPLATLGVATSHAKAADTMARAASKKLLGILSDAAVLGRYFPSAEHDAFKRLAEDETRAACAQLNLAQRSESRAVQESIGIPHDDTLQRSRTDAWNAISVATQTTCELQTAVSRIAAFSGPRPIVDWIAVLLPEPYHCILRVAQARITDMVPASELASSRKDLAAAIREGEKLLVKNQELAASLARNRAALAEADDTIKSHLGVIERRDATIKKLRAAAEGGAGQRDAPSSTPARPSGPPPVDNRPRAGGFAQLIKNSK